MPHVLFQFHQSRNYFHVHMPPRDTELTLGTEDCSAYTQINFVQSLLFLKEKKSCTSPNVIWNTVKCMFPRNWYITHCISNNLFNVGGHIFYLLISVYSVTLSSTPFVTPIIPSCPLSCQGQSCLLCYVLVQRPAQPSHYELEAPL